MDEPFSALDAQTRMDMQIELSRIYETTRQGVLYITHHIPEAVFLADRVVVLTPRPGRIARIFPVELPRPRREDVRVDPRYVVHLENIWSIMRAGHAPHGAFA
jgi:NitT/TauT family transport system ATP-binding protein